MDQGLNMENELQNRERSWPEPNEYGVYEKGSHVLTFEKGKAKVTIDTLEISEGEWIEATSSWWGSSGSFRPLEVIGSLSPYSSQQEAEVAALMRYYASDLKPHEQDTAGTKTIKKTMTKWVREKLREREVKPAKKLVGWNIYLYREDPVTGEQIKEEWDESRVGNVADKYFFALSDREEVTHDL